MIVAKDCNVEAARGRRGWTQTELSIRSGVSRSRINAVESRGEPVKPQTAKKICDALDCGFDELFRVIPKSEK